MISKNYLDKRICDVEGGENTQTFREFIREYEKEFCVVNADLDKMSDSDLNEYLEFIDEMWNK